MVVKKNRTDIPGELEKIERRIERLATDLVALGQADVDWTYHPPPSDEPKTWTGLLRFVYVDRAYRWHMDRARLLKGGGGPYYCPTHGEPRPPTGGTARQCWPCAWDAGEYDKTLALARELARGQQGRQLESDGMFRGL